jgi:hypothetical protein
MRPVPSGSFPSLLARLVIDHGEDMLKSFFLSLDRPTHLMANLSNGTMEVMKYFHICLQPSAVILEHSGGFHFAACC